MNANAKKTCPPGTMPSSSEEMITVQIIKDEPEERKVLDKPLGLAILELAAGSKLNDPSPKLKVVWANDYHQERFKGLVGKVCYAEVNKFDQPCKWCPVKKTFMDGLSHIALAGSPDKKDISNVTYSQIVSVPYARDDGEVRQVLEMVFDFRSEESEKLSESLDQYQFGDRLGDLLMSSGHRSEMADLLLFGFMVNLSREIDVAHCVLFTNGVRDLATARVIEHHKLSSENITCDVKDELIDDGAHRVSASKIRGMVMRPLIEKSKGMLLRELFEEEERKLLPSEPWIPRRLGCRKLGIMVPNLDSKTACLVILEKTDRNDIIFESAVSSAAFLISTLRRVFTQRERTARHNVIRRNLEKKLDMFRQCEGEIIEFIPFVLGKSHDLGRIITKQKYLMHTIDNLDPSEDTESIKEELLKVLQYTTERLSFLRESMKSVSVLKKPNIKEVDIVELVEEAWSLFDAQFREEKIKTKISGPKKDAVVDCDPELMKQVLFNLTDNSCKALRRIKGIKRIEAEIREVEEGVEIIFEDNGGGIDDDDKQQVFERYFSTTTEGTGLGLFFCKIIVEDVHNGRIWVESRWGKFTRFHIYLREVWV